MNRTLRRLIRLLSAVGLVALVLLSNMTPIKATSTYRTFTLDARNRIVRTSEAYTPHDQIILVNGKKIDRLEHIFIDDSDYLYITDGGVATIYILDENYNYVGEINGEENFYFPNSTYVTERHIYVVDSFEAKIFKYNKETLELVKTFSEPDSPIFQEGYPFAPENIAVDSRDNLYIVSNGSPNGLIMMNEDGDFLTFFGANPLRTPLLDQFRNLFFTDDQRKKYNQTLENPVFPDYPSGVSIDEKGFIFTVTPSLRSDAVKKINVSGRDYFTQDARGFIGQNTIWVGQYNNVYTTDDQECVIYEYDSDGNLLFMFGGKDLTSSRQGLLRIPVAIASNSKDFVFVADQGTNSIQVYRSTPFADAIHGAMQKFNDGEYDESTSLWEYSLEYNQLFDEAHVGLAEAYLRNKEYTLAQEEYEKAFYIDGMSLSNWEIRQIWLTKNLDTVFIGLIILGLLRLIYYFVDRKHKYSEKMSKRFNSFRSKHQILDELLYVFYFLRHPFDGYYEIKRGKRVTNKTATILYALMLGSYLFSELFTNRLFKPYLAIYYTIDLIVYLVVGGLTIFILYLITSINEGEGSLKNTYQTIAYALSPIILFIPFVTVLSHFLTLQEAIFYQLPLLVMRFWIVFLMFFMIKDVNNYEPTEVITTVFKTIFTLIMTLLVISVIYSLSNEFIIVVKQIISEVSLR
jgi:tetratricopeptide (TPR) repeat protein